MGSMWGFLGGLWYLSKVILNGKVNEELVWLWDAVSVIGSVTCSGFKSQLQETWWLKRNFMPWRNALTHFIHLSGMVVTHSWSNRDQTFPGVAQHHLLFTELAKTGGKRFHEGYSKQAHLLCQNDVSSVRLLRLEDYIPWSQRCILHPQVNPSMTLSAMLMLSYRYFLVKMFSSTKTAWCPMQVWNLPPR